MSRGVEPRKYLAGPRELVTAKRAKGVAGPRVGRRRRGMGLEREGLVRHADRGGFFLRARGKDARGGWQEHRGVLERSPSGR